MFTIFVFLSKFPFFTRGMTLSGMLKELIAVLLAPIHVPSHLPLELHFLFFPHWALAVWTPYWPTTPPCDSNWHYRRLIVQFTWNLKNPLDTPPPFVFVWWFTTFQKNMILIMGAPHASIGMHVFGNAATPCARSCLVVNQSVSCSFHSSGILPEIA